MRVDNKELILEFWRSKLSFTDLPRATQRTLPLPDRSEWLTSLADVPATGLVVVEHDAYLTADQKLPFKPFQLFQDGQLIASAFMKKGAFSLHGRLTDQSGALLIRLVENYARLTKWRTHSEVDEMITFALVDILPSAVRYDLAKWRNPFATMTQNTFYAFTKVANKAKVRVESRNQMIEESLHIDHFAEWQHQQNDTYAHEDAYAVLCKILDRLLIEETSRVHMKRRKVVVDLSQAQSAGEPMAQSLRSAISYGLSIGLSGAAIAETFNLDPATMSRFKHSRRINKS